MEISNNSKTSTTDNTVTVNVKIQMFSELGNCSLQLRIEQGEDIDNSEYYKEQAKLEVDHARDEADRAASIANLDIDTELSETSSNPVMNKIVTMAIGERLIFVD